MHVEGGKKNARKFRCVLMEGCRVEMVEKRSPAGLGLGACHIGHKPGISAAIRCSKWSLWGEQ